MSKTVIELNTAEDLIAWLDCCGIESHFVEKVRATLAQQPEHHDPIGEAQDKLIAEQAAQAQQEPVGYVCFEGDEVIWTGDPPESNTLLYTTPQAQRKPLTDEQIDELSRTMVKGSKSVNWLCRAIEAALGIKENNA